VFGNESVITYSSISVAQRICTWAGNGGRWTTIWTPRLCENKQKPRPCEGFHSSRSTLDNLNDCQWT
jgi:hypothetical protein